MLYWIRMEHEFWKKKALADFTADEWEAVCDGCGKCCYRKYISGSGRKARLYYTKVACDFLDLKTNRCRIYGSRFAECPDCEKLTKERIASCDWLPESCSYRMLAEGKGLPSWHPLVSGSSTLLQKNERDCKDWMDHVISSERYSRGRGNCTRTKNQI